MDDNWEKCFKEKQGEITLKTEDICKNKKQAAMRQDQMGVKKILLMKNIITGKLNNQDPVELGAVKKE